MFSGSGDGSDCSSSWKWATCFLKKVAANQKQKQKFSWAFWFGGNWKCLLFSCDNCLIMSVLYGKSEPNLRIRSHNVCVLWAKRLSNFNVLKMAKVFWKAWKIWQTWLRWLFNALLYKCQWFLMFPVYKDLNLNVAEASFHWFLYTKAKSSTLDPALMNTWSHTCIFMNVRRKVKAVDKQYVCL